jgi:hypothetical protein
VAAFAGPEDLGVVTRFTHGLTFERYYHGQASWMSVPAVADHRQHRWDLARAAMKNPHSIQEILSPIEQALKAGHKVFLVGKFPRTEPDRPDPIGPASQADGSAKLAPYLENWHKQIAYLLWKHAAQREKIPLETTEPIDPRENEDLYRFSGWKD